MSSSFQLTLDTTAPQITWGAQAGATAGELLQLGYTLDEPGIVSAQLELADGRNLALADTGLTLEAQLPPDTPNGPATVRVVVRDELLNQATRTRTIFLVGVVVIPEGPPAAGGLPSPARRRPQPNARVIRVRSQVPTTSSSTLLVLGQGKVGIAVATSTRRMRAAAATSSRLGLGSSARLATRRVEGPDSTRTLSREGAVTRRDGPTTEALLLDLI